METIKQFIEQFIQAEFDCKRTEYIGTFSDEEFNALQVNLFSFFHSRDSIYSEERGIAEENLKYFSEEDLKKFEKNSTDAIPRTLFQIKQYENPVLGDALKRIVTGNDLYVCYVSYPSKGGRDLYFSSIFYVAETNEGQKIIYEKSFNSDTGVWYHPVDMDTVMVIDEGKLIAVEKYQAPEEATSLEDYNNK